MESDPRAPLRLPWLIRDSGPDREGKFSGGLRTDDNLARGPESISRPLLGTRGRTNLGW
jgi:hypothetical protein